MKESHHADAASADCVLAPRRRYRLRARNRTAVCLWPMLHGAISPTSRAVNGPLQRRAGAGFDDVEISPYAHGSNGLVDRALPVHKEHNVRGTTP